MRAVHGMLGVLLTAGLLTANAAAQAPDASSPDRAALDKQIFDALKDMHNRAADLYNLGDANGAYRMFQGGLLMAKPLLVHRPEVQQLLEQGMQEADRLPSIPQRALRLHKAIEAMRDKLKPGAPPKPLPATGNTGTPPATGTPPVTGTPPGPMPNTPGTGTPPATGTPMPPAGGTPPKPPDNPPAGAPDIGSPTPPTSLWKRLGGEPVITKVVDRLFDLVSLDPKIDLSRGGKYKLTADAVAALKLKIVGYLSSVSDGTVLYTGRSMAESHKDMNITAAQFDEFVKSLRVAFDMEAKTAARADVDELIKKVEATRKDIVGGR